jgi:NADH-quinone oxidoreductase subunit E
MPMLYEAQDVYGYLPEEAIREVAEILELDATEVYAVSEFYSLYYHKPVGKYIIRFCTDMPCALVGAEHAYQQLLDILGIEDGESTSDGMFTVEHCVCLAACGMAPVFLVNRQYFENMTEDKMRKLINYIRTHGLPKDGPTLKSQERRKDTLTGF